MEPVVVLGVVAASVAFVDSGLKVLARLRELATADDLPKDFRDIRTRLPLILSIVSRTEKGAGDLDPDSRASLESIVQNCSEQVKQLNEILQRVAGGSGQSRWRRGVHAAASLMDEKRVRKVATALKENIALLTSLNTTPAERREPLETGQEPPPYGSASPSHRAPEKLFLMPFVRDTHFIGREIELLCVKEAFAKQSRVAIGGIGGIGKSQVAIEYCYRFREANPDAFVFWVYGSNAARFYQGYKKIAQSLQLPSWDDPNASILDLVSGWFSETASRFLIVLDNADDITLYWPSKYGRAADSRGSIVDISAYLPENTKAGQLLITTRDNRIAGRLTNQGKTILLDPISEEEAKLLFLSKVDLTPSEREGNSLGRLVHELDYIPLAVSQAAAFIQENASSISEYLSALEGQAFEKYVDEELDDSRRDRESINSAFRTWKLSVDQISRQKPQATELLYLLSMLDRQSIPRSILTMPEAALSIGNLLAFNLITTRSRSQSLQLHRLVQRFVRLSLKRSGMLQKWEDAALACVSDAYPTEIGHEEWPFCDILAPHVEVVLSYDYVSRDARLKLAHLLCWAADFDVERGMYAQGLCRAKRSRDLIEELTPEDDQRLGVAMSMYGKLQYYQATSEDEVKAALETLTTALQTLAHSNIYYSETAFELAYLLYQMGRREPCIDMIRACYESAGAYSGLNSVRTLDILDDYALVLALFGREEEGIDKWREVVDACATCDTNDNTKAVYEYRSMASIAEFQGDEATAEILYARLLAVCSDVYSEDHTHVLDYRLMHAEQILRQGRYDETIQLTQDIMKSMKSRSDWEIQAGCLQMLAECHKMQGNPIEEEGYRIKGLNIHTRLLGRRHELTIDAMDACARCYMSLGQYREAERRYQELVALQEEHHSFRHAQAMHSHECFGICLARQGKYAEAEVHFAAALAGQVETTPRLLHNLCCSLYNQRKWDSLESQCRRALLLEGDYRSCAYRGLIDALEHQGMTEEALRLRAESLGLATGTDPPAPSLRAPVDPPIKVTAARRFGRWIHPRSWSA